MSLFFPDLQLLIFNFVKFSFGLILLPLRYSATPRGGDGGEEKTGAVKYCGLVPLSVTLMLTICLSDCLPILGGGGGGVQSARKKNIFTLLPLHNGCTALSARILKSVFLPLKPYRHEIIFRFLILFVNVFVT